MSSQGESSKFNFPENEEKTLAFWNENDIYQQSLDQRRGGPNYVFFEGPPTANGKPHPGHCLTRAIKDLFPRYKTMKGFYCERKAGWDTHGLPVEVEVCKELGIHAKEEIEEYGVEPFIQKCQQSVWQYMQQWERLTQRLGFWVKLDDAYVTYHKSYVESVWWSLKNLFDRKLLYEGHKILWWWAQGGTALSSGEVGQGYKTVRDPSVYVRFPLVDRENTSLLVWTTTPWTLPSNQFAAVKDDIEYAVVYDPELDHNLIFAKDLVETIAGKVKRELEIKSTLMGSELVGERYQPPFDCFYKEKKDEIGQQDFQDVHLYWRVLSAEFVTTDSGTGLVHQAPAFGEVDYQLYTLEYLNFATVTTGGDFEIKPRNLPELFCPVMPNGKFDSQVPEFEGIWVKDADKPIIRALKESGSLFHQEQYEHEYPFCWRADSDPLIQYPRRSWFIRTASQRERNEPPPQYKDKMLANNQQINWLPNHIKDGRFGNFLESNVDWALSRERFWGTPLPIWKCEATGQYDAIGSYDELLQKPGIAGTEVWESAKAANPDLVDDLKVHKPYIDAVSYDSPFQEGARMNRVTEVIDCWYDSGAMPFAQWGYPHQGHEDFKTQFPADFISEALDQTRGWFYSQLAISTLLFGDDEGGEAKVEFPHPFKNCIVLGLMLAEGSVCVKCAKRHDPEIKKCEDCGSKCQRKTEKMSKRLKNYRPPNEIFDLYGADALRWYFFANQPPWTSIIYSERAIKESIPEFLLRMWNVYSFFTLYAGIDGFDPSSVSAPGQLNGENLASGDGYRAIDQRSELDRWIISELNRTIGEVTTAMDAYDNYGAARSLNHFVDVLSNWYVRRSRDRFWAKDTKDPNKLDAYWTLYECLATLTKLNAPFVPFITETIWQNLTQGFRDKGVEVPLSVHLCDYPESNDSQFDADLSRRMELLRQVASLGLSARMGAKLKVRQPLSGVTVVLTSDQDQAWLETHVELLKTELNVRDVTFTLDAQQYVTYNVVPNFKRLGPKVGKLMPKVKKAFGDADGSAMLAALEADGKTTIDIEGTAVELTNEDVEVRLQAKEGWAAAQGAGVVVVLATELTPELIRAGMARDLNRLVQDQRKAKDLERTQRISLVVGTDSEELSQAIEENGEYLCGETLADSLDVKPLNDAGANFVEVQIGEVAVKIGIELV